MKFEIVCRECAEINRSEIPIVSNKDGIDYYCHRCESLLVTFYADEHFMGKAIGEWISRRKESKVIKK